MRHPGNCQDCGRHRLIRPVMFWLNGYTMRLCEECEKVYRPRLNTFKDARGRKTYEVRL